MEARVRIIFYLHVVVTSYLMVGAYLDGSIFPDMHLFGIFALAAPLAFPVAAVVGLRRSTLPCSQCRYGWPHFHVGRDHYICIIASMHVIGK